MLDGIFCSMPAFTCAAVVISETIASADFLIDFPKNLSYEVPKYLLK